MTLKDLVDDEFEQRARGRPRKEPTTVVNFRIPIHLYDKLLRYALRRRIPARSVIRHIVHERVSGPDFS